MARFDAVLAREIDRAAEFAAAGELVRLKYAGARSELPLARMELMYELAYLKMYIAWESFLEETFLRYLCGHESSVGQQATVSGKHFRSLREAETAWLDGKQFRTWYDPTKAAQRCSRFIKNGTHEAVLLSATADLENCKRVRHRIGHGQDHARREFDVATLAMATREYAGSSAGAFLRDFDQSAGTQARWLASLGDRLIAFSKQILP